jgi:hypothetical protein
MYCCFAANRRGAEQFDTTHLSLESDFRRAWSLRLVLGLFRPTDREWRARIIGEWLTTEARYLAS